MFCRQCGNELYDTDLFCNRCGAPVTPGPSQERAKNYSSEGLTPAAKDAERIIEEFYRTNKRKEETQSILDMEFHAIKGEATPHNLDEITYRGRDDYARPNKNMADYEELVKRESARKDFMEQLRPDLEKAAIAPQVSELFDDTEPSEAATITIEDALTERDRDLLPDHMPDPDDEEAWNELLLAYRPILYFDPPEYLLYEEGNAAE